MTTVGFLGLPGSGKSTVFRALTRQAVAPQFLGYDLKPNQAVVKLADGRLDWLQGFFSARQKVPATVEFTDIPGFDPASTDKKLKQSVLEHYRNADALALVVNLFDPDQAQRSASAVRTLLDELVLLSLITAESAAERIETVARMKADKDAVARFELLKKVRLSLEQGVPVRRMDLSGDEEHMLRAYAFLSQKPLLAVLNVGDAAISAADPQVPGLEPLLRLLEAEGIPSMRLAAALEAELVGMGDDEAREYMAEFGLSEPAIARFIRTAYETLGLITFLTGTEREVRAWPLRAGATALEAAGSVHTDMARGFIRAEVIHFDELSKFKSLADAKAAGKVRVEGKTYVVSDGDYLFIRFNV